MLRAIWLKFDRDWGWSLARLLAYTCLMAHFAVLGMQLAVLGLVLRFAGVALRQTFIAQVTRLLPDVITSTAVSAFEESLQHTPAPYLLVGAGVAVWYGSRFFVSLEDAFCIIFRRPPRPLPRQNLAAFLMLALFSVILPIIVLSSTLVPFAGIAALFPTSTTTETQLRLVGGLSLTLLGFAVSFLANFLLLLVALTRLTPGGVPLRAAAPGAFVSATLTQAFLLIFPIYAEDVLHYTHYGSIAGLFLVALVFIYAYALFIVLGAELASWRMGYRAVPRDILTMLVEVQLQSGLACPLPDAARKGDTAPWRRLSLPRLARPARLPWPAEAAEDAEQVGHTS
jgi:uncharacterized BrkB/YihY/UPF0761 family membrane protein